MLYRYIDICSLQSVLVELRLVWWFVLNVYPSREDTEKIQFALEDRSGTGI